MVSGQLLVFAKSESVFAASVIECDKVEKGSVVKRGGRAASGESKGTVVEDGVCMRILIARYCWPVVAFEGREVDPALTRARDVIDEVTILSIQLPMEGNSSRGMILTRSSSGGVGSTTVRWRGAKMVQGICWAERVRCRKL